MRKLLLIIATVAVPLGVWTAGCRNNNRQAAFPNTPEMKALAKSGGKASDAPPMIPEKPIDRDILNIPEQHTMARLNAVNDRGAMIAAQNQPSRQGMFTLPEEQNYVASTYSTPTYDQMNLQAAPAAMAPVPSPREFWSRPARPLPNRPVQVPHDVSAMAAPGRNDDLMPPPPGLAPSRQMRRTDFLPSEPVPGVFMGTDAGYSPLPDDPPPSSGWIGMRDDNGDAHSAPPLSSKRREIESRNKGRRKAAAKENGPIKLDLQALLGSTGETESYHAPASAPLASAPSYMPDAPLASGRGLDMYEPLPEPVPIEQYVKRNGVGPIVIAERSVPAPLPEITRVGTNTGAKAPVPEIVPLAELPTSPVATRDRYADMTAVPPLHKMDSSMARPETTLADMMKSDDINRALAPLPDISSVAKSPVDASVAKPFTVSMPAPMPDPLPPPELAGSGSLMGFSAGAMSDAFPELGGGDPLKTDLWDQNTSAKAVPAAKSSQPPAALPTIPEFVDPQPRAVQPSLPPMVEMSEPAGPAGVSLPLPPMASDVGAGVPAEPRKIRLEPIHGDGGRSLPGMEHIDNALDVPPLKF